MTAATLPLPAELDAGRVGVTHLCHLECEPMAFCGVDVAGWKIGPPTAAEPPCPLCVLADDTGTEVCCGGVS